MILIAMLSPTGGAGRSSLAVAAATGLHALGRRVVLLQADPANSMGFQLGLAAAPQTGIAQMVIQGTGLAENLIHTEAGFRFLPFGHVDTNALCEVETRLVNNTEFWRGLFSAQEFTNETVVIIDLPRWPSVWCTQVLKLTDLNIINLIADSASILGVDPLLPKLLESRGASYFMMNRFDSSKVLHLDLWALCKMKLSHRLLPFYLHEDQALPESQAAGIPLHGYSPNSQLLEDIQKLCNWIDAEMG